MSRPHIAMRKIRDALRLTFGERLSRRQVSRSVGIPTSTLGDYVGRAVLAGLSWPLPEGLDYAALERLLFPPTPPSATTRPEPDWGHVHTELRKKAVTLQLLWIEYRELHPDGLGYSQFCHRYQDWRRHVDATMRQVHRAGERLFVDFPGMTVPVYDERTGAVSFSAELFVAVLGASSYVFAEALHSQALCDWVKGHVDAFEFFGGVPELVVCDNLKSGVTKAHRYEPDVNATYQDLACHYGTAILPTRPSKPRDKAKVEVAVQIAERWIIARVRNRRFTSLAELNEAIAVCVEWINARRFKKMDGSRRDLFISLDRPALRALPNERYEFATWRKARVNIDYHVEVERHYYSVPHQLVGQLVDVRTTSNVIEVFFKATRVASHPRSHRHFAHSTDAAHMPEAHRRHAHWTPSRIVAWADKTGPSAGAVVAGILASRPHPEQGYRSALGIIRLADKYGTERVEAACARALHLRSFTYRSVESILKHELDRQPLPTATVPRVLPDHHNVRGAHYYS